MTYCKRRVCHRAARYRTEGKNKSQAMKLAWRDEKRLEPDMLTLVAFILAIATVICVLTVY